MKKYPLKAFSLIEISVVIVIIGILIAGISSGIDLFYDFKLTTARSLTKSAPVPRIEGLITWIETTSPESFSSAPKDGESVGLLKDISFQMDKVNFVQSTSANKPIYKQANLNNLPALYFDGSNDFLATEKYYNSGIFSNNQVTIFAVINYVGDINTAVFLKHEIDSFRVCLEINNGKARFDFPYPNIRVITDSSIINKNVIITALADKFNQKIYINSVLEKSDRNTYTVPTSSSSQIYLGANTGGGLYNTKFNFGELIIYDRALTAKELDSVTKYLSKKWGIKI